VIARDGGNVVITRETGTFVTGESISVSATVQATITEIYGVAADGLTDATYQSLAAADYRSDIQAVPGSGSILGVAYYKDNVYAWRNNAGGTAAVMYKSSGSGWTAISLLKELAFTGGVGEITSGQTVTGATSGATGVALESLSA